MDTDTDTDMDVATVTHMADTHSTHQSVILIPIMEATVIHITEYNLPTI